MDICFNSFEKIDESMHIASKIKLRDSIHSIVIDDLQPGEEMELPILSKKLYEKFNIKISAGILEQLLFIMWWRKDDYTIFRDKDRKWLDVWPWKKTIERKKRIKDPPLGKSKRKMKKEEDEKKRQLNSPYYRRTIYPTINPTTHNPNKHHLNKNSNIDDEDDDIYQTNRWWRGW